MDRDGRVDSRGVPGRNLAPIWWTFCCTPVVLHAATSHRAVAGANDDALCGDRDSETQSDGGDRDRHDDTEQSTPVVLHGEVRGIVLASRCCAPPEGDSNTPRCGAPS